MWVILASSVVGVAVFLERLWSLQRARVLPRAFVDRIRAMVAKGLSQSDLARKLGVKPQRIQYAANECNYCPACQTGGRVLRDRALSRLLKEDWPRTLDDL